MMVSPAAAPGPLEGALSVLSQGLENQAIRVQVAAENYANAEAVARTPGGQPYQRKAPSFRRVLNRQSGVETLQFEGIRYDQAPFREVYDPHHPAAHLETGIVLYPNVQQNLEMLDFQEAFIAQSAMNQGVALVTTMLYRVYDLMLPR